MIASQGHAARRTAVLPAARRAVERTFRGRRPRWPAALRRVAAAVRPPAGATATPAPSPCGPAAGPEADRAEPAEPVDAADPAPPGNAAGPGSAARPADAAGPGNTTPPGDAAGSGNTARPADAAGPASAALAGPGDAAGDTTRVGPPGGRRDVHLLRRTIDKAWSDRILGLSAEAAFWQLLSLPPLFLALLGSLGYLSSTLGEQTVSDIEGQLLDAFSRAFTPSVVDQVIGPTVSEVLRDGRADVVSIGFLIALWAGSSATATFVNTITIAYGMRDLRGAVSSRLRALWLYLLTVVVGAVMLPVLVLGPSVLVRLVPEGVRGDAARLVSGLYWPVVGVVLLAGLVTFYHVAPPRALPWRRGVPGALLAAAVFLLGSTGLRAYISFVVGQGLSYGALAAPIAALLFFYVLAIAVLLGAELNAAIEELWPSRPTRRQRRRQAAATAAKVPGH